MTKLKQLNWNRTKQGEGKEPMKKHKKQILTQTHTLLSAYFGFQWKHKSRRYNTCTKSVGKKWMNGWMSE